MNQRWISSRKLEIFSRNGMKEILFKNVFFLNQMYKKIKKINKQWYSATHLLKYTPYLDDFSLLKCVSVNRCCLPIGCCSYQFGTPNNWHNVYWFFHQFKFYSLYGNMHICWVGNLYLCVCVILKLLKLSFYQYNTYLGRRHHQYLIKSAFISENRLKILNEKFEFVFTYQNFNVLEMHLGRMMNDSGLFRANIRIIFSFFLFTFESIVMKIW